MIFKDLRKIYFALFIIILIQFSCTKDESIPQEAKTEELIYDKADINGTYADQALTDIYSFLPKGFSRIDGAYLDAATDDAITSQLSSNIDILAKAFQSPTQVVDDQFASYYTGIHRANLYLSKIDVVPIPATVKVANKSEARFLRAMFYFELIKRYGGVPLIGDKILTSSDNLNVPRNTFEECVEYVAGECDAIQGQLRTDLFVSGNTGTVGRATQGAALALKSRLRLYAASPLNNPTSDPAKWQLAANAAKAVIDLAYFQLNNPNGTNVNTSGTKASFTGAFISRVDKEVIFAFQQAKNQNIEKANAPVGYTAELYTSSGTTSPTQDLVDAFPTIKGLPITADIKTGANTTGYDAASPYANRDPRLDATVFYNGQQWLGRAVETFDGGKDRPGGALVQTKTGYYLRKFSADFSNATNYTNQDHNFIIFRYAEILLNYAEALNEVGGAANTTTALNQLYTIRKRAGILPGTPAVYGVTATTQAQVRDAIRLERRIELAFEEQRFWDARRWKTAQVDFNKNLRGVKITKPTTGLPTYQYVNVGAIAFKAPMYLYPISFAELLNNSALTQNPGW